MEFYIFDVSGNQYGPARIDEINAWVREGRIDASMQALQVGTVYRFPISQLPGIIMPSAPTMHTPQPPMQGMGSQYSSSYGGPQASSGYGNYPRAQSPVQVDNHLVKAIFSTLCCCMPLGVVAIVYAAQVQGHARRGDYGMAHSAASTADTWANWSIGVGLVGALLQVISAVLSR
jgi:hypothetical protein